MSIAAKTGCTAQNLNEYFKKAEVDIGQRAGMPIILEGRLAYWGEHFIGVAREAACYVNLS